MYSINVCVSNSDHFVLNVHNSTKKSNWTDHKCKGKAIPVQAWIDSEDSRRMMLPYFKTIGT
jgi:hypothetical protein